MRGTPYPRERHSCRIEYKDEDGERYQEHR